MDEACKGNFLTGIIVIGETSEILQQSVAEIRNVAVMIAAVIANLSADVKAVPLGLIGPLGNDPDLAV